MKDLVIGPDLEKFPEAAVKDVVISPDPEELPEAVVKDVVISPDLEELPEAVVKDVVISRTISSSSVYSSSIFINTSYHLLWDSILSKMASTRPPDLTDFDSLRLFAVVLSSLPIRSFSKHFAVTSPRTCCKLNCKPA